MTNEKRNHAIEWITRELGFLRSAPALNGCEMKKEWAEQIEVFEAALEALNDHVREDTKMIPLTLEQLRVMTGRPVYVKFPRVQRNGFWAIVYSVDIEQQELILNNGNLVYGWYGDRVIAYAYPLAHIDQEACMMCKSPLALNRFLEMSCRYCPKCGRPLTPEALAMQEKRIRG